MKIPFTKYHGTANDFILLEDPEGQYAEQLSAEQIAALCDRRTGIGADGLICLQHRPGMDYYMHYYNADGAPSSLCGNGSRCTADYARSLGWVEDTMSFGASDGMHRVEYRDGLYALQMVDLSLPIRYGSGWILDTGSPHYVERVEEWAEDFIDYARVIRHADTFPQGINVNQYRVLDRQHIEMRTYERGVEAETYSCGTGAVAAALIYSHALDRPAEGREITLETRGGTLHVQYDSISENQFRAVWLIGPAVRVYSGIFQS